MLESGNKQASDKFTWREQDYCPRFLFSGPMAVKGLRQSCHFEHTCSGKLCFSLVRLERWSLGAIETMLQGPGTLFRCQGFFFLSMLTAVPSLIRSCSLPWMRHPAQQ